MKKQGKKILISWLSVFALLGATILPVAATSEMENEKESIQQEIENNQQQQNEQEKKLADIEEEINALSAEISKYDDMISDKQAEVDALDVQMGEKQVEIDEIQKDFDKQYEDMKLRIQYMYENGDSQMLELLLTSNGFADFLNRAQYFSDIVQYDRDMLDKLDQTRIALEDAKGELQAKKDTAIAAREDMKSNRKYVMALKDQQNALYAEVEDELYELASREEDLEAGMSAIDAQIQEYLEEQARREEEERQEQEQQQQQQDDENNGGEDEYDEPSDSGSDNYGTSSYGWCWPAPGCYQINDYFGWRTDPYGFHRGIDLQTGSGTPYVAVADAYVAYAGWGDSFGYYVMLDHGDVMTIYAHSSELFVETGQWVSQGEVMGLTGNTGYSFGAHLHFAVYKNGDYVDPLPYLP